MKIEELEPIVAYRYCFVQVKALIRDQDINKSENRRRPQTMIDELQIVKTIAGFNRCWS